MAPKLEDGGPLAKDLLSGCCKRRLSEEWTTCKPIRPGSRGHRYLLIDGDNREPWIKNGQLSILPTHPVLIALPNYSPINDLFDLPFRRGFAVKLPVRIAWEAGE